MQRQSFIGDTVTLVVVVNRVIDDAEAFRKHPNYPFVRVIRILEGVWGSGCTRRR